jgi:hypothetical protein
MTQSPIDIDRMVREVLAALADTRLGPPTDNAAKQAVVGRESMRVVDEPSPSELTITSRVVTLSQLHGRLNEIRRVVVPCKAVVTPAVRDELRNLNIAIVFATTVALKASGLLRLLLATSGKNMKSTPLVDSLANSLSSDQIEIVRQDFDCAIRAVKCLAAEVRTPNTLGLLLTRHVAAALCLANRNAGVRAITGIDARLVAKDAAAVGANLLLIDPSGGNTFRLRQAVAEFCRGGVRPCPENIKEELA